jgi:hypothetical protein
LRVEARDRQEQADNDLAQAKDGLVGHDGHPEWAPEPRPLGVRPGHRFGLQFGLLTVFGWWGKRKRVSEV